MDLLTASSGGNQYLRPEYLTPLPTTLDAKKSPLAMLAQTCSQIGAEPPATKSLLASITSSSSRTSGSGSGSGCSESSSETERSASSSSATSSSVKTIIPSSKGSITGGLEKKKNSSHKKSKPVVHPSSPTGESKRGGSCVPKKGDGLQQNSSPKPRSRSNSREEEEASVIKRSPSPEQTQSQEKRAVTPPPIPPLSKSSSSNSNKDKLNLSGHFPSTIFPPFPPTNIPPYLHSYARLKAAASVENSLLAMSGHGSSSGLCRDPYCNGCSQLGSAGSHLSSLANSSSSSKCAAGCLNCDHHKSPHSHLSSFFPPFHHHHPSSLLASLYHSQNASINPYVCNWIGGDAYCGKRFSSSEELLQHLRSHTSLMASSSESASASSLYSRTYPTPPLSPHPLTSSSSSSSRYHPYSKPGIVSTSSLTLPPYPSVPFSFGPPPPGGGSGGGSTFSALAAAAAAAAANNPLSPYFPYAFYGHRLGSNNGLGHP